jgi:hypothetical protein
MPPSAYNAQAVDPQANRAARDGANGPELKCAPDQRPPHRLSIHDLVPEVPSIIVLAALGATAGQRGEHFGSGASAVATRRSPDDRLTRPSVPA